MTQQTFIGFVARHKVNHKAFAGWSARCKVYSSRKLALNAARRFAGIPGRPQTDDEVLQLWDILPVYVTEPA